VATKQRWLHPWTVAQLALLLCAGLIVATSGPRALPAPARTPESGPEHADVLPAPRSEVPTVDWMLLAELDLRTGEPSGTLAAMAGPVVRIPGFMVPLEDFAESVSEFLLVPYVGACVHTPPPPPNQLVYVRMDRAREVDVNWWEPIWIHGRLEVASTESVYGEVGFRFVGYRVEPYEY